MCVFSGPNILTHRQRREDDLENDISPKAKDGEVMRDAEGGSEILDSLRLAYLRLLSAHSLSTLSTALLSGPNTR